MVTCKQIRYQVNWQMAEPMSWGQNQGCDFAINKCVENSQTNFASHWCLSPDITSSCTQDRLYVGYCGMGTDIPDIPPYEQYFGSPTTGGFDYFADHCPLVS